MGDVNAQQRAHEHSHDQEFCKVDGAAETLLAAAMQSFSLSARAYNKILIISRTIVDLDGAEEIRRSL